MNIAPEIIGVGGIFIDEIDYPGKQRQVQLGGGVLYALQAMTMYDCRPGLVGYIGDDFPADQMPFFDQFCTAGLRVLDIPQIRALQVYDSNGTRKEIPQTSIIAPFVEGPLPTDLPISYCKANAMYLIQSHAGIECWKSHFAEFTLWEPNANVMTSAYRDDFRQVLADCRVPIVSPNLSEAKAIYGERSAEQLIKCMQNDGANIIALRMGAMGSLVAHGNMMLLQPAISVARIVDETGAGNSYCGAFVLAMLRKRCIKRAAQMAAQAAAHCIQRVGLGNRAVQLLSMLPA